MPGTFLGYPFDSEIFLMNWQAAQDPVRTAMIDSGAVQRNRAKRLMREAYRHIESASGEKLKKGFLIVIAARTGINGVKCDAVERDLKYALKKAELLLQ